jgi:uncharacterized protein YndB with AHSA1/START domain
MPRLRVATTLDATPEEVWEDICDIASHVEWMHDAAAITFTSDREEGVGTTFDCDTRVGPFRLTDHMEITSWAPGREMGVRHVGLVTGTGVFTLTPVRSGRGRRARVRTKFVWTERLRFPWYFGGPLGALAARPVLGAIWRRNLKNLARRF